jgi:exosortase
MAPLHEHRAARSSSLASLSSVKPSITSAGRNNSDEAARPDQPPTLRDRLRSIKDRLRSIQPRLLVLGIGMVLLGWAYGPNFQDLYTIWNNEPNYSHGKLVIPIALLILWQRLADPKSHWTVSRGSWWSWTLLVAILALRAFAFERGSQWLENATFVPAAACLMLTLGGWPLLQRSWPAVVFLVFMLPLPQSANNLVALPLQRIATLGSVFVLTLTGLLATAAGNVIALRTPDGIKPLEVALACNGLSMLMTLAATVTATIMLIPLPTWKRITVLVSAIPIALLSNIIRIVATGWAYYYIKGENAKHMAHDWSGFLMMPLALLLVLLELQILSWLADAKNSKDKEKDELVLAVYARDRSDKIKTKSPHDDF